MKSRKVRMMRRRTRKVRGGGKLNRLPIGPGSRNAAGKPTAGFSNAEAIEEFRGKYARSAPTMFEKGSKSNANFKTHLDRLMGPSGGIPKYVYRGIIKPANYNEMYPIALSLNTTGTLPYVDVRQAIRDNFATNWDFKYVCGHGVLAPHLGVAKVPERTYVRFNSPAGCLAVISGEKTGLPPIMAFPETFSQGRDQFLNDMVTHFIDNTGPLESFNSTAEREEVKRTPFSSNFCMRPHNVMSESTLSECLSPLQKKATIYGPGENVAEMKISFINNPGQLIMLGMYDLPLELGYYQHVLEMALDINARAKADAAFMDSLIEGEQKKYDSAAFKELGPNLIKDAIGNTLTLTEVFAALPPVPEGKVRFLFINACRGVPITRNNIGLMTDITKYRKSLISNPSRKKYAAMVRRASLSGNTSEPERVHRLLEARKIMIDPSKSEEERAAAAALDAEEYARADPSNPKYDSSDVWEIAVMLEKSS